MSAFEKQVLARFDNVKRGRDAMHHYQKYASQFQIETPYSALFIDLGLGKTCISLTTLMDLVATGESDLSLVIAPLRVANETWPTEIGTWAHTAGLTWAHVRDDELLAEISDARKSARKAAKDRGVQDPDVWAFVKRGRLAYAKSKVKAQGYHPTDRKDLVQAEFDAIKGSPLSQSELTAYATHAADEAAKSAVRRHRERAGATIHIINRENVKFLVDAWGRDWPYDTVVIDESSSLKDHSTQRFKALAKVRPLIKRMMQLTATPAAETYLHLFAQIYLLDRGERFGRSFVKFRDEYFDYNEYSRKATLKPGAEERIIEKISDICLTMKAEDYLEMKEPIFINHEVSMPADIERRYRQLETESILEVDGQEIEADGAASLCNKLLQFSSGVVYDTRYEFDAENPDSDGVKVQKEHLIHDLKIEKLRQLQEESCGKPLLVSYWFKSTLARLKQAFPEAVALDKKGTAVKKWNEGKIPMLLVHPASAGHGLNLQYGGNHLVLFDIPWSLELYLQLIGRLNRQGQTEAVIIHHILLKDTLDRVVVDALSVKNEGQERLFKKLKDYAARLGRLTSGRG